MGYDLACFMHDKKVGQLDLGILGHVFSERCFENMLGSKTFVKQIINLFDSEPRMGMICPPPPNHSGYYITIGMEWGPNYEETVKLAEKLDLTVPIAEEKEPVAPLGTMFWFRPRALEPLLNANWKYEDFPQEPNKTDGTILHAIERIYPFVIQQSGYYSAWVLSDAYMRTEWTNLSYMLRTINEKCFAAFGPCSHFEIVSHMTNGAMRPPFRIELKRKIKRWMPKPVWELMRSIYHLFGGKKLVG